MLHQFMHSFPEEEDPESLLSRSQDKRGYRFRWWHALVVVVIAFPYISIFVLFGLVASGKGDTTNNYTTEQISATTTYGMALPTTSTGKVVSFDESGALQVGAGTSLYNNLLTNTIGANICPGYTSLAALASGFYLLSFSNKVDQSSTLQLIYTSAPNEAQILTSVQQAYFIFSTTVALDIGQGTFLSICQDYSASEDEALLIPGSVNYQTKAVTLNTANAVRYVSAQYSVYPSLIRLSNTAFAISYASTWPLKMATRSGSLDANQVITLSEPAYYADNPFNSTTQALTPLTETTYLVAFYDQHQYPNQSAGSLLIVLADVSTNQVRLSNATTNDASLLSYYLAATTLANDTVVVVYSNANDNDNLVAQVVKVLADNIYPDTVGNYSVTFGATWMVNSGRAFYANAGGYPDIDVEAIDDDGNFLVLFSDLSNNLAVTATQGRVTSAGEIVRASPDFVLYARLQGDVQTASVLGALAAGSTETLDSETAVFYAIVDASQCTAVPIASSFNLLHRLPGPAGITASTSSSAAATTVAVSGVLSDVYSTLLPGRVYYANTLGSVVDSEVFLGRTDAAGEGYVMDTANNAFVTTASKVGFAVQANQLLVQLAN